MTDAQRPRVDTRLKKLTRNYCFVGVLFALTTILAGCNESTQDQIEFFQIEELLLINGAPLAESDPRWDEIWEVIAVLGGVSRFQKEEFEVREYTAGERRFRAIFINSDSQIKEIKAAEAIAPSCPQIFDDDEQLMMVCQELPQYLSKLERHSDGGRVQFSLSEAIMEGGGRYEIRDSLSDVKFNGDGSLTITTSRVNVKRDGLE